jgi:hypothetical protein
MRDTMQKQRIGMDGSKRERLDESCAQYVGELKEHRALFDAWRRASEALVAARASGNHTLIAGCRDNLDQAKSRLREWEMAKGWNADLRRDAVDSLASLASRIPR